MNFAPLLRFLLALWLCVVASGAAFAEGTTSAQDARIEQMSRELVGPDPTARLYFGEAMAALDHRAEGDALRGALIALWLRRAQGEAADATLTIGGLLAQAPATSPFAADSPLPQAWAAAIGAHVRLHALDERAAADLRPPAEAPATLRQAAPGLWTTSAPVGPMILFVTAHQDLPTPLPITRLHVQWLGTRLDCAPVRGSVAREQDALFSCEGNLRAASLPAMRLAVASSGGQAFSGVAEAGEFDTTVTIAAWVDALAAGHEAELKRLLTRPAPCEVETAAARHCAWAGDPAPGAAPSAAAGDARQPRPHVDWSARFSLILHGLGLYVNWLLGGAIVCWLACHILRSSSLFVEVVVHLLVVHGLLFLVWVAMIVFLMFWHQRIGELGIDDAVFWGSKFMAFGSGIVLGGVVHMALRFVEWVRDNGL